jgi:hypothetical protein
VLDWTRGVSDHGDSGGPLYCGRGGAADYIHGTVSRHCDGEGSGHRREYYQNAQTVASWIQGMVQSWAPTTTRSATARGGKH